MIFGTIVYQWNEFRPDINNKIRNQFVRNALRIIGVLRIENQHVRRRWFVFFIINVIRSFQFSKSSSINIQKVFRKGKLFASEIRNYAESRNRSVEYGAVKFADNVGSTMIA